MRNVPVRGEKFDASTSVVNFGGALPGATAQTMFARFMQLGAGQNNFGHILARTTSGTAAGAKMYVDASTSNGRITMTGNTATTGQPSRVGTAVIANGVWMDAAGTWDGSNQATGINLYIAQALQPLVLDTPSVSNAGSGAATTDAGNNLTVGNRDGGPRAFNGHIAIVARWNRVLDLGELWKVQRFGPLVVSQGLDFCYANGRDYGPYKVAGTPTGITPGTPPPMRGIHVPRLPKANVGNVIVVVDYFLGSDIAAGSWTTQAGSGTSLYASVDETVEDDTDYIKSALNPSTDVVEMKFHNVQTPNATTNHTVSYSIKGDASTTLKVELICGTTIIKTWTHSPAPATFTRYDQTLTSGEAATITNYTDLRLRLTAG